MIEVGTMIPLRKGEWGAKVEADRRDVWLGLFIKKWDREEIEFYLCLIPCLPLHIKYRRRDWESDAWQEDVA